MDTKVKRLFAIIPVDITYAGQLVKIERKLPEHFNLCKGLLATIKGYLRTEKYIQHIGEISLLFNSGQVHPFHHTVGFSLKPLQKRNTFVEVKEQLIPNYHVTGFYQDAGNSRDIKGNFLPYSVNIYLDCKAKI